MQGTYGGWPSSYLTTIQGAINAKTGSGAQLQLHAEEIDWSRLNGETGIVQSSCFPCGFRNIEARYTAGYDTVPDDIQTAVAMLAAAIFRRSTQDGGMKREKIGQYEYERFDVNRTDHVIDVVTLCPDAAFLLDAYRKIRAL